MSQAGLLRVSSGSLPPQVPISFVTDAGTATPIANTLQVLGVTTVAGSTPVSTSAPGALNIVDVNIQRAQAIAATDATKVGLAAFDSADFTVDANGFVSIVGVIPPLETLTGNTGVATPSANNINIVTANCTPKFIGAGSTLTLDFNLDVLALGSSLPANAGAQSCSAFGKDALQSITTGRVNSAFGNSCMANLTTGINNCGMGQGTLGSLTTGSDCTAIGTNALAANTGGGNTAIGSGALLSNLAGGFLVAVGNQALNNSTGIGNTAVGWQNSVAVTTGTLNTSFGVSSLGSLTTGDRNIAMGISSGNNYTGAESSNIVIANAGVLGESNVMRLGTQGTGAGQQSQTYIAGVINTVSGRVVKTTAPGAYPYLTLITDYVILVDTTAARTINLVASPVTGTTYRIKDITGTAGTNNITVTPNAGNIDGSASFVMNSNYASIDIVYNGTSWSIF